MTPCQIVQPKKGNIVATFTMQDLNTIPVTPEEDEAFKALGGNTLVVNDEDDKPSMYWNHRVVDMSYDNQGETWLEVQEVFYNGDGQPCGHCDPCVGGGSIDEIQIQIQRFTECLSLPILNSKTDFNNKFDGEDDGKEQV